jgi:hypothetical protein
MRQREKEVTRKMADMAVLLTYNMGLPVISYGYGVSVQGFMAISALYAVKPN